MSKARDAVRRVMAKTAAFPPFSKNGPPPPPPGGIPQATKRDIPKEHPFDPKALKPMAKALLACSVSLGHALTAYRHLSRLKSVTVSPDGRLGGRGYVMEIQEARQKLYNASEALSAVSDTLFDEINAPHWKPKLAMLDESDEEDVSRYVEEAQEVLENPEEQAEEQLDAIEKGNDKKDEKETDSSQLPEGDDSEPEDEGKKPRVKEASLSSGEQLWAEDSEPRPLSMAERIMQRVRGATEPGVVQPGSVSPAGPRVDNRDPDGGEGPWGSFNPPEDAGSGDEWAAEEGVGNDYLFEGEHENDVSHKQGESAVPGDQDDVPTEGRDFGLGYGARGQGEEHAGEWGPHAELPGTPWQSVGDTTPIVDVDLNTRHAIESLLPGDTVEPVARTDYYEGEKGNLVQTAVGWAQSVLDDAPHDEDLSLVDTGHIHEDLNTPWLPLGEPRPRK